MPRDLLAPQQARPRDLLASTQPEVKPEPSMPDWQKRTRAGMKRVAGTAEVVPTMASGMVAAPVSGIVGLIGGGTQMLPGDQSGRAARWQQGTQEALTYEPKTETGKGMIETISKPFEYLDKAADVVGDYGGGSSPLAETAIKTIILALPMALGMRSPAMRTKQVTKGKEVQLPTLRDIADTPDKKARRLVAEALERDGLTPDEAVAKLQALGPNARLADLGENLSGLARAATAKPGPARTKAKDFLEERQSGQTDRLINTAGLGNVREFKQWFASTVKDRQSKAAPLYKEAYDAPLDLTSPQMQALMKRPTMRSALNDAVKILKDEGGGTGHVRVMDAAKRNLDDRIGSAIRGGKREEARRLSMMKRELVDEIDRQVPAYKQARDTYAGEASMRDAAQTGRNIMTRKMDLDEVELVVQAMGEGERRMFQAGVLRGLVDKLEGTATGRNAAGKLIESPRAREVLRIAFPDEAAFNTLFRAAEAESQFSKTRGFVRGGSPTARIQAEGASLGDTASALSAMARGDILGTTRGVLKHLGIGRVSDKTLGRVGELLFDRTTPPKGMTYNQRGELVPNPPTRSGPTVRIPGVSVPTIPSLPAPGPGSAATGSVIASIERPGMPSNLTAQTDEQRRRQMLAQMMSAN